MEPTPVPAGPVDTVTVAVADLEAALDAYRAGVGLVPQRRGRFPAERAAAWRRPELADRRQASLAAPGDGRPGTLLLVEVPGVPVPAVLTTLGWAAAELVVADADAAADRARGAGLPVLAEPAPVGAGGGLRAVQVAGPGGEALYLTEIRQAPPGFALPRAIAPVGRVFIAVLASGDLELSREALERALGGRRVTDHPLAVRALNHAHGLPPASRHRVSSMQLRGLSAIEVDQYPSSAGARGTVAGGIVAVSIRAPGRRVVEVPAAGGALLELAGP